MKYLVTGATGFIGVQLCREIIDAGHELLAYSGSGKVLPDGTPTRAVDFTREQIDQRVLDSVDGIFHLAGIAHRRAEQDVYQQVNHRAVLALAQGAKEAGVGSFVFLSSVKAMGASGSASVRGEADFCPPGDAYGRSKRDAEVAIEHVLADADMRVSIVRPTLVYGEGAKANLALLASAVQRGLPRPPEQGARSMISRDDLCALMLVLASDAVPGVHTYIASDGEAYSTRRIYDALREARGMGQGTAWCPTWAWRLGCTVLDGLGNNVEPAWQRLFGTELYSSAAVQADTAWRPRETLETFLQRTGGLV